MLLAADFGVEARAGLVQLEVTITCVICRASAERVHFRFAQGLATRRMSHANALPVSNERAAAGNKDRQGFNRERVVLNVPCEV